MKGFPRRDEVWLVALDPAEGSEMQKTRPCLVVSPDEVNAHLRTVMVAPVTTKVRAYPTRVGVKFQGKTGQVALDQMRAVDRGRLGGKLGQVSAKTGRAVGQILVEMFRREEGFEERE